MTPAKAFQEIGMDLVNPGLMLIEEYPAALAHEKDVADVVDERAEVDAFDPVCADLLENVGMIENEVDRACVKFSPQWRRRAPRNPAPPSVEDANVTFALRCTVAPAFANCRIVPTASV